MAGKIFINYRRSDDPGFTQALFARLEQAFPADRLFMDVDNIEPGLDFVRVLEEQVSKCDVLISVIGKSWLDARDPEGGRRIDNADDFVRIEIESALKLGKLVIPVLVGDAQMPRADDLPPAIQALARRNAVRLTHERFRADAQGLIAALRRALGDAESSRAAAEHVAVESGQEPAGGGGTVKRREGRVLSNTGEAERKTVRRWRLLGIGAIIVAVWALKSLLQAPTEPRPPRRTNGQPAVQTQAPLAPVRPNSAVRPPPAALGASADKAAVVPLLPDVEHALKPGDAFTECANCPEMVVVSAGAYVMGAPENEPGRQSDEGPQHEVMIAAPFAVSRFAITFDDWDACIGEGGCEGYQPSDQGWGRGRQPVINVSWNDAKSYLEWLSRKTGRFYRLLTEAEYEYAARAGAQTAYPWGDRIGDGNASCRGCGSRWDGWRTAPVGSFAANRFGLFDMLGNVWAWVEDCHRDGYDGAPADGSAWTTGNCYRRVVRGGSYMDAAPFLRSAKRGRGTTRFRFNNLGFRVARTLSAQ